jgi:hypothetical protein
MERRKFITKSLLATTAIGAGMSAANAQGKQQPKELYELRVYEIRWSPVPLDTYLSKALIPALNRMGVKKVGAFTEIGKSEPAKLYLLIPYSSFEEYGKVTLALRTDQELQQASTEYNQIPVENAVYSRYESSVLLAFDNHPKLIAPENGPRIFELRTYEGYSEDAVKRKLKMFNESEFDIFDRVKLNRVFFGEMIAGKNLPCLTYMITFKNMEERDKNWKSFGQDPDWQKISKAPEYANTVSKIYKTFLEPLSYSQI